MKYPKLIDCLMRFSFSKLQQHLGEALVEQLIEEWSPNGPLTKKRMAEMIVRLNGVEQLKKANFRTDVLLHLGERDIERIFAELSPAKKKDCITLRDKALAIASIPWSTSGANLKMLELFGIDPIVFAPPTEDTASIVTHQAGKRFYELLDYQFVIKQRVLTELNKEYPLKRMLIHMPTGTGKTKTSMHTLVHFFNFKLEKRGAIIWLAHTTELLHQAYDTFSDVWNNLGDGVTNAYKIWGNRRISVPAEGFNGMLFCGIQKMQSIRQNQPELFEQITKDARLIVFDEAHKAAAPETRQLVESFMCIPPGYEDRSLIGLTATPGRTTLTSAENRFFSEMFDNHLIGIDIGVVNQVNMSHLAYLNHPKEDNIIRYFQNANILAKIKKEELTYAEHFTLAELNAIRIDVSNGDKDFTKATLEKIGKNRSRNKAILDKLRELAAENIPTIVFACSVAHAKLLSFMLSLEDIPNALVLGEQNDGERTEAISSFKDKDNPVNILINYEVLTTGFDSKNIRCVFITRPTQSVVLYSQMLGRGLRGPMMGGNAECLLVDIKDNLGQFDAELAFNHFDNYWS